MRHRHGQRGQTTTEFLMIAGLMTAFAIVTLRFMVPNLRTTLQHLAGCIINEHCVAVPGALLIVPPGLGWRSGPASASVVVPTGNEGKR
jgi:hypothetical protein